MAAKQSASKKAAKPQRKGGGLLMRNLGLVILGIPLVLLFMPTVLLLAFALLPTFVAVIVDRSPQRYGGITVGGLNFAGVAPYLLDLWMVEHSVPYALDLLADVMALILIYGSAAFGWVLFVATPTLVSSVLTLTAGRRLTQLKAKQKQLLSEWGPEVAQSDDTAIGAPGWQDA